MVFSLMFLVGFALADDKEWVSPSKAINYLGQFVMVCGVVSSTDREFNDRSGRDSDPGDVTFLYFEQPATDHQFAAAIQGEYGKEFSFKSASLVGQKTCVYGKVKKYKGKAVITLVRAEQIDTE